MAVASFKKGRSRPDVGHAADGPDPGGQLAEGILDIVVKGVPARLIRAFAVLPEFGQAADQVGIQRFQPVHIGGGRKKARHHVAQVPVPRGLGKQFIAQPAHGLADEARLAGEAGLAEKVERLGVPDDGAQHPGDAQPRLGLPVELLQEESQAGSRSRPADPGQQVFEPFDPLGERGVGIGTGQQAVHRGHRRGAEEPRAELFKPMHVQTLTGSGRGTQGDRRPGNT